MHVSKFLGIRSGMNEVNGHDKSCVKLHGSWVINNARKGHPLLFETPKICFTFRGSKHFSPQAACLEVFVGCRHKQVDGKQPASRKKSNYNNFMLTLKVHFIVWAGGFALTSHSKYTVSPLRIRSPSRVDDIFNVTLGVSGA